MPDHQCQQRDTIAQVKTEQARLLSEHKGDISTIRHSVNSLTTEIRIMCSDLREALMEDREQKVEIKHLKDDVQILHKRLHTLNEHHTSQQTWIDRADGMMKAFLVLPSLCAIVSAGTAIWMALR